MASELVEKAKEIDLRDVIQLRQQKRYKNYNHGLCPFHENDDSSTPSFMVFQNGYRCLSTKCGHAGNIFNWYAYTLYGDDRADIKGLRFKSVLEAIFGEAEVRKFKGEKIKLTKATAEETLDKAEKVDLRKLAKAYHKNLLDTPLRMTYFFQRGFTEETVCNQMWGWDGQHYVITVWEGTPRSTELLALRLRSAAKSNKLRYSGIKGHNQHLLYNREALLRAIDSNAPYLLVFYGEFDAQLCWQDGLYAVSPTNGAKSVEATWFDKYKGNIVFVPDKGEEMEAYKDAAVFGVRGWVAHLPEGNFKDYTEFRNHKGKVKEFVKQIPKECRIKAF